MTRRDEQLHAYALDPSVRVWQGGTVVAGGSPWRLSRLKGSAAAVVSELSVVGSQGAAALADHGGAVDVLVSRGIVHPRPAPALGPHDVTVVVAAYGRARSLRRTLDALRSLDVLVVDDGTPLPSPVADAAREAGARYLRMEVNSGPAAARNAGLTSAATELVALVDSDCEPEPGWLDRLVPFFDDPRVAVVTPRIVAKADDPSLLARYERSSSALDMGSQPALVRPGSRLGFVPSATMLVRRSAVVDEPFDTDLRLGEDVDLVWRLADAGLHVRYEPSVSVVHELRGSWRAWAQRRFEYGTSSASLEARHPGRLAPLRVSPWNAAALGLVAIGQPVVGAVVTATAAALLARRLARADMGLDVAGRVVGAGVVADAVAVGHALRREYWPLGALALAASPWSRSARAVAALMVAPVVAEWVRERPELDPLRYTGIRLVADAAYGSGVIAGAIQGRTAAPLLPRWRRAGRAAAAPST